MPPRPKCNWPKCRNRASAQEAKRHQWYCSDCFAKYPKKLKVWVDAPPQCWDDDDDDVASPTTSGAAAAAAPGLAPRYRSMPSGPRGHAPPGRRTPTADSTGDADVYTANLYDAAKRHLQALDEDPLSGHYQGKTLRLSDDTVAELLDIHPSGCLTIKAHEQRTVMLALATVALSECLALHHDGTGFASMARAASFTSQPWLLDDDGKVVAGGDDDDGAGGGMGGPMCSGDVMGSRSRSALVAEHAGAAGSCLPAVACVLLHASARPERRQIGAGFVKRPTSACAAGDGCVVVANNGRVTVVDMADGTMTCDAAVSAVSHVCEITAPRDDNDADDGAPPKVWVAAACVSTMTTLTHGTSVKVVDAFVGEPLATFEPSQNELPAIGLCEVAKGLVCLLADANGRARLQFVDISAVYGDEFTPAVASRPATIEFNDRPLSLCRLGWGTTGPRLAVACAGGIYVVPVPWSGAVPTDIFGRDARYTDETPPPKFLSLDALFPRVDWPVSRRSRVNLHISPWPQRSEDGADVDANARDELLVMTDYGELYRVGIGNTRPDDSAVRQTVLLPPRREVCAALARHTVRSVEDRAFPPAGAAMVELGRTVAICDTLEDTLQLHVRACLFN